MISPELQRAAIQQWAARTDHRIVDWVEDLDKTGRNFKRRIMRAIERVEGGEAEAIGVWKYSRFGRSREGIAYNLARVERVGAQLLSATEDVDASTAIGKLQRGVLFEFAAFESDRAGEQWSETHKWRRDHGLPATGRPRFGYIWHPRKITLPDGTARTQREFYEPDENLREAVVDLYRRYVAGTGFVGLAYTLNEAGHRTTTGGLWGSASLIIYMDSGFPAGYLRVHDRACKVTPYKGTCPQHLYYLHPEHGHQAVIDEELWQAYLNRRALVKKLPPRSRAAAHPLTGLVFCGACGFRGKRNFGSNKIPRYVCAMRRDKGPTACEGQVRSGKLLMETVFEWVQGIANRVHLASLEAGPSRRERATDLEKATRRRARLEADLAAKERAIKRHMKVYAMADDDSLEDEFMSTLDGLRNEKADLADELAALGEQGGAAVEQQMIAAVPVAVGLVEEWRSLDTAALNALLRRLIRAVVMEKDGSIRIDPVWGGEV
jgi:DNA invertase Pin-like site-specific DNA recombinase